MGLTGKLSVAAAHLSGGEGGCLFWPVLLRVELALAMLGGGAGRPLSTPRRMELTGTTSGLLVVIMKALCSISFLL
jgi:hypothetical protein